MDQEKAQIKTNNLNKSNNSPSKFQNSSLEVKDTRNCAFATKLNKAVNVATNKTDPALLDLISGIGDPNQEVSKLNYRLSKKVEK